MGASSVLFAPHLVLRSRCFAKTFECRQTVHQRDRSRMIPKILHYTFGMAPDFGGKPWSLIHHVCLACAVERIGPERILFYCQFEPSTPWWNLSRELLTLVKIEAPKEIFGRPLEHVAHQSDVVRLERLIADGGIYLEPMCWFSAALTICWNIPRSWVGKARQENSAWQTLSSSPNLMRHFCADG